MTVNQKIIKALSGFPYPCKPDIYDGPEKKYFTFNDADERGGDFGDDAPGCVVRYMQIHYFLPLYDGEEKKYINYLNEKNGIREALFDAGFTYPVVTNLTDKEKNIRHIIFECAIEEERKEQ